MMGTTEEYSEPQKFARKFWTAFNDYAFKDVNSFSKMFNKANTPPKENKYRLLYGSREHHINLNYNARDKICKVRFVIVGYQRSVERSNELFDTLYSHKSEIEKAYGKELQWVKDDDKKLRFVEDAISFDPGDSNSWIEVFEWYMDSAVKMDEIIAGKFRQ